MFILNIPTHVTFGAGCRHGIVETLAREGWRRVAIVVDHGLDDAPVALDLIAAIGSALGGLAGGGSTVIPCAISEPTYDSLDAARGALDDAAPDAVIGIGGGSALDMAKAMAVLANNREPAIHYRGFDQATEPVLPIIAVPTTAGTGSEVTPNASFVDTAEKRKLGINGEAVRPRYAFLDAELTVSCPRGPTVSAGVDSIVHASEAYVARKSTRLARLFATEGMARVVGALARAADAGDDLAAREEVMYGAFLAGVALMHSGTGPAAAMSYPLGVRHGVPHGIGGAIFLPHVIRHNAAAGCDAYAGLYDAVAGEDADPGLDDAAKGLALADQLAELWERLDVPSDLAAMTGADAVERFVSDTLDLGAALEQNPVAFGESEIRSTLANLRFGGA